MTTSKEFIQTYPIHPDTLIYCVTGANVYTHESYKSHNIGTIECLRIYFSTQHLFESEKLCLSKIISYKDIDFTAKYSNAFNFINEIKMPVINNVEQIFFFDIARNLRQKKVFSIKNFSTKLSCADGPAVVTYYSDGSLESEIFFYDGINLTMEQNIKTVEQLQNYLLLT